jgi:hypothetical protein
MMPGFSVAGNFQAAFQDTGQGASGRIASWMAWGADPNPLPGPEVTNILREDDNGAGIPGQTPVPLGQGGCGGWAPMLDGFSNGATSGGDNCFFQTDQSATNTGQLFDSAGNPMFDSDGQPMFGSP